MYQTNVLGSKGPRKMTVRGGQQGRVKLQSQVPWRGAVCPMWAGHTQLQHRSFDRCVEPSAEAQPMVCHPSLLPSTVPPPHLPSCLCCLPTQGGAAQAGCGRAAAAGGQPPRRARQPAGPVSGRDELQ